MPTKQNYSVELHHQQWAYLIQMAEKHELSGADKAMRILIDHARTQPELEEAIFTRIRCIDCSAQ